MAFARLFFPTEAKLAMDIANAETTSEFAGLSSMKGCNGNLEREVDLNETPLLRNKRLLLRMEALQKTGMFFIHGWHLFKSLYICVYVCECLL